MTTTLEQFSSFSYIWLTDRDQELEEFLKTDPLLLDFRAKIKSYEEVDESINELPEYYDVGPISLLSGECNRAKARMCIPAVHALLGSPHLV